MSRQANERKKLAGQERKLTPHEMGRQVPHRVHTQESQKVLYGQLRMHLGDVFHGLAQHKESRVEEGHMLADHVHMLILILPKYAVSNVVGYIKRKSATHLARVYGEKRRNFTGKSFWARGYFALTVGRDEAVIRN